MKETDLAIMDAMDAVEKIADALAKQHGVKPQRIGEGPHDFETPYDYQYGKLDVIIRTLRGLLS